MSGAASNDTESIGADVAKPRVTLDYPPGMRPSTDALARLTVVIGERCRVDGLIALGAAVLIDQGRIDDALDQLTREREKVAERRARDAGANR